MQNEKKKQKGFEEEVVELILAKHVMYYEARLKRLVFYPSLGHVQDPSCIVGMVKIYKTKKGLSFLFKSQKGIWPNLGVFQFSKRMISNYYKKYNEIPIQLYLRE